MVEMVKPLDKEKVENTSQNDEFEVDWDTTPTRLAERAFYQKSLGEKFADGVKKWKKIKGKG